MFFLVLPTLQTPASHSHLALLTLTAEDGDSLMILVLAVGGVIGMENPGNSLVGMQERFAWLVRLLESLGIRVIWLSTSSFFILT